MIATKNGKSLEIGEHSGHKPSFKWRSPLHTKRTVTDPPANNPGNNFDDLEVALITSKSSELSGSGGGSQVKTMPASEVKLTNIASARNSKAVTACSLYSFCSVSMIIVNKSLASSYQHLYEVDMNILLVVFQAIIAVIAVDVCKRLKWVEYPDLTMETARAWAPVNIFFCMMLFTGMTSLQHNSVPMVTVFKNVTNIITTAGDYFFFGNKTELLALVAFGVMLSGAIAAAWHDIEISTIGLFWMATNCFSTSGYVLYMKHATQTVKMSKFGMVYVNNVLATVFLLPAAFATKEVSIFLKTTALHTPDYFSKTAFAGLVGFFLNFASLHCVSTTGPTTYAIVGSLNKVPVAILGYLLFDNVVTKETWFFIAISLCGGFLYTAAKLQTSREKAISRQDAK